jgi:hypothetical protein
VVLVEALRITILEQAQVLLGKEMREAINLAGQLPMEVLAGEVQVRLVEMEAPLFVVSAAQGLHLLFLAHR